MTKKEVQAFIRQQFGMDLCEFIKSKVYDEKLYDYEISRILNVSKGLVSDLRKLCGTKKANAFTRRFELIYGEGALERFKRLVKDTDNSLSDVARAFSFSREYARQVYEKIYGHPYTVTHRKKAAARRKRQLLEKAEKSKQARVLNRFRQKLRSRGIRCHIPERGSRRVILANGHKLVLRFSSRAITLGKKQYFKINYTKTPYNDCDFFVCICDSGDGSSYYIIPRDYMPKCTLSLSPQAGIGESKYARFKDAWHLLRQSSAAAGPEVLPVTA